VEWEEDAAPEAPEPAVEPEPAEYWEEDAAPKAPAEPAEYWDSGWQKRTKKTREYISIIKAEQLWFDFKSLKFENKHPHISDE
jgi:hypothetical protein